MVRRAEKGGGIKPWAITWSLAILAAQGPLIPVCPDADALPASYPLWVWASMVTLRFLVLLVLAQSLVTLIIGILQFLHPNRWP
ncbi:hypothetical protein [Acidithiobacillus sp.]